MNLELLNERYIAGLKPVIPGFRRFEIEPHMYGPKTCKAAVAICCGRIEVSFGRNSEGIFKLTANKPDGFGCVLNFKEIISEEQVLVNGIVILMDGCIKAEGLKELGESGITFGERDQVY